MNDEAYSAWEEYKALKKQRQEIDARMRELKEAATSFNLAKYGVENTGEHYIAIKHFKVNGKPNWVRVANAESKDDVFKMIPSIIESLQGLQKKVGD
jgi:hypothetical protein